MTINGKSLNAMLENHEVQKSPGGFQALTCSKILELVCGLNQEFLRLRFVGGMPCVRKMERYFGPSFLQIIGRFNRTDNTISPFMRKEPASPFSTVICSQ